MGRKILLGCISALLIACTQTPGIKIDTVQSGIYVDHAFPTYQDYVIEDSASIFALTPELKRQIERDIHSQTRLSGKIRNTLEMIFGQSGKQLHYQNSATLIAMDTYTHNQANCLSLSILAYAIAEHAELNVHFQEVDVPEYWTRSGGYSLLNGHVNLMVTGVKGSQFEEVENKRTLTVHKDAKVIDFDPSVNKKRFPSRPIEQHTVIAMFYNNKGAAAISTKEYDKAYAYFKQATLMDKNFSAAWGNLGLLYRLRGFMSEAEENYKYALSLSPNNLNVLGNMAVYYQMTDNTEMAQHISKTLNTIRKNNPYYHAMMGTEAFHRNEFIQALQHYKKAVAMNMLESEFHFGLAKTYLKLGRTAQGKAALKRAKQYSTSYDDEAMYQSKLDFLARN